MSTCPKCGERAEAIGRSGCDAYRCITCGLTFEETAAEAVARTATVTGVEKMPHCEKPCRYCGHKYERGCEHCSAQLAQTHGLRLAPLVRVIRGPYDAFRQRQQLGAQPLELLAQGDGRHSCIVCRHRPTRCDTRAKMICP